MNDDSQSRWYTPISVLVALGFGLMACVAAAHLVTAFLQPQARQPEFAAIVRFAADALELLRRAPLVTAGALLWGSLTALLTPRSGWQFLLAVLAGLLSLLVGGSIAAVEWAVAYFDPRTFVGPQLKALEELALLTAAAMWLAWLHLRSGRLLPGSTRFVLTGFVLYVLGSLERFIPPELLARPQQADSQQAVLSSLGLSFLFWLTGFVACWKARPSRWRAWPANRALEQVDADALRRAAVGLGWMSASMLVLFLLLAANAGATILERFRTPTALIVGLAALAFLCTQWGSLSGIAGRLCCAGATVGFLGRLCLIVSLLLILVLPVLPLIASRIDLVPELEWRRQVPGWLMDRLQPQRFPPTVMDQAVAMGLVVVSSFGFLVFAIALARIIKDQRSARRLLWMSSLLILSPVLVVPLWFIGPERYLLCVAIIVLGESPMVALVLGGLRRSLWKHIRLVAPEKPEEYLQRGTTRYVAGDHAGAIWDFTEVIRQQPNNVTAYLNRGAARLTQNDNVGAVADFTAVLERDPKATDAYLNLVMAHRHAGDTARAVEVLTRAAEKFPDNSQYVLERGQIHLEKQDYAAAVADFTRVIEMDPGPSAAYQARAKAYEGLGQPEKAAADLAHTRSDNPFA